MATILKQRARKPLAAGKVSIAYGMRAGINGGAYGVSFSLHNEDSEASYSVHISNDELDSMVMSRQSFGETHVMNFNDKAKALAADERQKDARDNLSDTEQQAKALKMALTMLRTFMPGSEQDRNATLAYIASVAGE